MPSMSISTQAALKELIEEVCWKQWLVLNIANKVLATVPVVSYIGERDER